ncbi:acetylornithine transaminase [Allostreptomyces psammosilenae]|uniref:Acetylornithine aminotransferase n=1 Tax=Allostreptomyces psammosilenae TaxID=1892865 RepID=A0A852ZNS4_9ACTN|nr:acetylornithine transaminase [Allostreptomyces psammosilenae]NYI04039.1 acetylornithine aminotransferase [Allostreptomyces psammosilenae]
MTPPSSTSPALAQAAPAAETSNAAYAERWRGAMNPALGAPELALVSGSGARVTDADGTTYTDFLSGVAVNALGHAHPAVIRAVTEQIGTVGHVSNLFISTRAVELAERLLTLVGADAAGGGKVFFANSGAEANEAAFKIARRTGRPKVISAEGSFHGRTMGALALTGQPGKRSGFEPLPGGVEYVPYGDVEALRAAVDGTTAAVLLEPIQGEYGVRPAPDGYLRAAREITREHGALLILDEVQTGIGRTGYWFAHQAPELTGGEPVVPDVMTLAKGIGGGLPLGACVALGEAAELLQPGQHASTFGGNPVCCAAGLAVLDTIEREGLLDHVTKTGKRITEAVRAMDHPLLGPVRGLGLLIGLVLTAPVAAEVAAAARRHGFLVNAVAADVIRLAPPLVVTEGDTEALLAALPAILDDASAGGPR